jgi:hypothetical protein
MTRPRDRSGFRKSEPGARVLVPTNRTWLRLRNAQRGLGAPSVSRACPRYPRRATQSVLRTAPFNYANRGFEVLKSTSPGAMEISGRVRA